jgi:hypothetical protein
MKRPDLAGHPIWNAARTYAYLVEGDGTFRWIPDPTTLQNLWGEVYQAPTLTTTIEQGDQGPQITSGAILASSETDVDVAQVYLIDNGHKRLITNFEKFPFERARVVLVPDIALSFVPSGPNIS